MFELKLLEEIRLKVLGSGLIGATEMGVVQCTYSQMK